MFEKLLANLPYNPNLRKQMAFYARRLRHEEAVRRTGFIFIGLAFFVQFFAVLNPPQPTTAYSSSDMINGGISSKDQAVSACRNNVKNYGDVLANFGIDCNDVMKSHTTTIRSTDYDNRLFSMSWLPYGNTNPHSHKPTDETPYNLDKVRETIYARRLSSADTIPYSTYTVLKGVSDSGKVFYIMFGCGNLMFPGVPKVEPPKTVTEIPNKPPKTVTETPNKPPKPKPVCELDSSLLKSDPKCVPCEYNPHIIKTASGCKPCTEALSSTNVLACVVQSKSAANSTQGIADANNTTAQPGDTIVYTLYAQNKGKEKVKDFVMQENISDVLDYADIVSLHGGTKSDTNLITWPKANIAAGSTLTNKVTVRIKNPIPQASPTPGDPNHFDYILTNVYGNTVNIKVPTPPGTVAVVTASETLPKTGPESSLLLAGAIVVVAGYFFARTRLLVDETVIVLQETNSGGR